MRPWGAFCFVFKCVSLKNKNRTRFVYVMRAIMLHTVVCCNNFVRSTEVGPEAMVRRLSTSYVTGAKVDLKRVRAAYS